MSISRVCMCSDRQCKKSQPTSGSADSTAAPTTLKLSASVGEGGVNKEADVKGVQAALNRVPGTKGGPNPLLEVDGKCGPLTKSAIGRLQNVQFGWSDCRIDAGKKTEEKLREFAAAPAPGPAAGTLTKVYASLPIARELIRASLRDLDIARKYLNGTVGKWGFGKSSLARVNRVFHLDKYTKAKANESIGWLSEEFMDMETILGHETQLIQEGIGIFQPDVENLPDLLAFTYYGGWTRRDNKSGKPKTSKQDHYAGPDLRQDAIYICDGLDNADLDVTASTVVHELAHFVGPEVNDQDRIADWSYRFKPGFFKLTPYMALRTADCYAVYARLVAGLAPNY